MKKLIFYILSCLLFSAPIWGQTTLPATPAVPASPGGVIPAPDGTTIVSKANVWSCVATGSGLPAGLTFDGTTLTAPALSAAKLTLTGGTTYAAGQYLVSIDASGNVTYTKYTAPIGGGSSPITLLVQVPALAAYAKFQTTVNVVGVVAPVLSGTTITAGMAATASPINPPFTNGQINGYYNMQAWVSANSVVSFYFNDNSGAARPAQNWIVKVQ